MIALWRHLKNGTIRHYETLVRMIDKEGSVVPPGMFIDTAEALGLIRDIDRIIIEKTMKYWSKLLKEGKQFYFSINLSAKDLDDREFLEFLKNKVMEVPTYGERPVLEITETAAVHDPSRAVKFIRELKSIGCKFSLDDFGVGFTSFRYLKEMEVDYIKIDGSFIKMLAESQNDRLFVKSMVDVAQGMGIKTVAEFVENEPTIKILRELGVDYAQGYFIGKPAPEVCEEG
jgi:EAL domain-containing protein (putative c-di-GMP-specific phosphodiesterase class I)